MDKQLHKRAQRLSYQCAEEIAKELRPGCTEKQAADLMDTYLKDHGVKSFFHRSFAWFGDRSRFKNFTNYLDFMPSDRVLGENDVVILDTAPIVEGYVADIGYTFSLTEREDLLEAKDLLIEFREEIPRLFESDLTLKEIWKKVDQKLRVRGYVNCHSRYPLRALGHRVHSTRLGFLPSLVRPFGFQSYLMLLRRGLFPEILSPNNEGSKEGLWAIEPHIGKGDFGAKFEEILCFENGKARWLDNEVPHMKEHEWRKNSSSSQVLRAV